ncbi:AraC family transcriptional regulator [Primorskyibacter flagellatus]|uniref:AraC family transcriptional regulator n=1 Tax=Primorskyibacter flagellatus TaxID=1387277 RepID=A0A917A3C4_9RHOB|nr:AraC family transcriptional regulator [Primorskyibacter flagellatus]GGE23060.1 AraC family transcriptional regulator [Primorskyibacter flagellatus]
MYTQLDMDRTLSRVSPTRTGVTLVAAWPNSAVAAARFCNSDPVAETEKRLDPHDGYYIVYHHGRVGGHEFRDAGSQSWVPDSAGGSVNIFDLNTGPSCRLNGAFDGLDIYVPRAALDDVAEGAAAARVDRLVAPDGWETRDPVFENLARLLLAATQSSDPVGALYASHLLVAVTLHVTKAYGGMRERECRAAGGLAPWQLRRAQEMLSADLSAPPGLGAVAATLGLSPSHFLRAFRASAGCPPHAWLQRVRIARAKDLLMMRDLSLADIALETGFADQSHFSRTFLRHTGTTPGRWRAFRSPE